MESKNKEMLQAEVNKIFNETVKYMQFRFQELANTIGAIPVIQFMANVLFLAWVFLLLVLMGNVQQIS